ncbi:MAG: restriction endonuclease subunit S [Lachnospiraceae bacterium]|nr:restriction endonuclease subunit S [Lachnospiraceae bacterium]
MKVKLTDVAENIFAGGDVPKDRFSEVATDEYKIPIYANAEKDNGLYGYTDVARVLVPCVTVAARGTIGFTAKRTEPFLPVVRLITVIPNEEKITLDYLYYALRNCRPKSSGTSIPQLTVPGIKNYFFKITSISKQEEITRILDEIEQLIEMQKKQINCYDWLIKSRFIEMFGDPVNNSFGFSEAILPELGVFGRGVSKHRPRNAPELLGGSYPVIQTGEVAAADLYITSYTNTYSELGFQQSKMWDKGTLCITVAANIAKTAILGFDACFPDSIVGFNANEKANNVFIHYWFSFFQTILEAQAPESAQKNINLKILSELKVIVPPIELQNKFAVFVHQVEKLKSEEQKRLEKTQTLFDSLMQKYFG